MTDTIDLGERRILHPGKLRWLRALGWMVALFFAVAFVSGLSGYAMVRAEVWVMGIDYAKPTDAPMILRTIATIVSVAVAVGLYWLAVRYGEDRAVSEMAVRPLAPELATGLLIGFGLMAATIGVMGAAGWVIIAPRTITDVLSAARDTLESGVIEEILFRLIVFRLLWRGFGMWPALAVSAALFGALHLSNPNASAFAALCIALEAGIMLAAFYIITGRVWMSVGVHAGWNFTQGWIFGAAVSGTNGFAGGPFATAPAMDVPGWLSGGSFGPEASLAALLLCTAAGVGVLWLAWRGGRMG